MIKSTYPIKLYFKNHFNFIASVLSILLNLITWVWLAAQIRPQTELIFLHYNILFGVDYVGEWYKVYYVPLTGWLIIIFNFLLGWFFFSRDKFIAILLNIVNVLAQIFLALTAAILVFLNS